MALHFIAGCDSIDYSLSGSTMELSILKNGQKYIIYAVLWIQFKKKNCDVAQECKFFLYVVRLVFLYIL